MFENPYSLQIKKILFEILKERYSKNEMAIERIASISNNNKDFEIMANLIINIYESAYFKSINEQKDIMEKNGLKVKITNNIKKEEKLIFKNKVEN